MRNLEKSGKPLLDLDTEELRRLYWENGHNIRRIAKETSLSRRIVRNELRKLGPLRSSRAQRKYWRAPFSENKLEVAYLRGLRAGDLNATRRSKETIVVRVSTTHTALLELFSKSFARYGHCALAARRVFLTGYDWQIRASLDRSFAFLLEKPTTTDYDDSQIYSFVAGVSDSDGTWAITRDKTKTACGFILSSENRPLLDDLTQTEGKLLHASIYLDKPKDTIKILSGISR